MRGTKSEEVGLELAGLWSFNSDFEKKYTGTCVYSDGRGTLNIITEDLSDFDDFFAHQNYIDIYGITNKGKCTLFSCICTGYTANIHNSNTVKLYVDSLVIGEYRGIDDDAYSLCTFSVDGLYEWLGSPALIKHKRDERAINVECNSGDIFMFGLSIDIDVDLSFHVHNSYSWSGYSFAVNTKAFIKLKSKNKMSYSYIVNALFDINSALCLMFGYSPKIHNINFYHGTEIDGINIINVHARMPKHAPTSPIFDEHLFIIPANYTDDVISVMQNFKAHKKNLEGVAYNIKELSSGLRIPLALSTYMYMQIIDVLCKEFNDLKYCEDHEIDVFKKEMKRFIKENCPPKIRGKLKTMINYANEYSFEDKTTYISERISHETKWELPREYKDIIKDAIYLRNKLTHSIFMEKGKRKNPLPMVFSFVRRLAIAETYKTLGVSPETIKKCVLDREDSEWHM